MGWARAYNLVSLFGSASGTLFPSPDVIFSAQYDANIIGTLEQFIDLTPQQEAEITARLRELGIRGNCRDENGWYRTQQTVSAVAQDLGLEVNNSTGFLPRFCRGEDPYGPGICVPYSSAGPFENPYGECCNPWSAAQMMAELEKPAVNNILVAWEHKNIQFLSRALANFPPPNDAAVEKVANQVVRVDEGGNRTDIWEDSDFGRIYKFTYLCNGTCAFESLDTGLKQNFHWLGPKFGSGFSVPDDFARTEENAEYIGDEFVTNECIDGSSCPVCPSTNSGFVDLKKASAWTVFGSMMLTIWFQ